MKGRARIAAIGIILSLLLMTGYVYIYEHSLDHRIDSIASQYKFSIPRWEIGALFDRLKDFVFPSADINTDDTQIVREYLSNPAKNKALKDKAERILAGQINEVLDEEGIRNPFVPLNFVFPPLTFEFEAPPSLLVISPRDEIRLSKRIVLVSGLSTDEKEELESQVDALGVSSLVVGLGGVGFTYPPMILETTNIRFAINTAVEEWFHQYLAFKPLGFRYVLDALGIHSDYEVITMNETVAGIVSEEIGAKVYQKYYATGNETISEEAVNSEFDIAMRNIRVKADEYLSQGKVDEAEKFMQEERDLLDKKGYHIRKLNQAYFAFYGTYANEPTSVSPIGRDLKELREQCSSLKDFLDKVTGMTSYDDLKKTIGEIER